MLTRLKPLKTYGLFAAASVVLLGAVPASAATVYAVTTQNNLIQFDSASPGGIIDTVPISGLQSGERVLGIDFRPANGQLYALGSSSRIYAVNPDTGGATAVGVSGSFALTGSDFGFDFNPTVDRIRVVSDADQNLRLIPGTGALAATDGTLAFAAMDPNQGANPNVVGAAYTNSFPGATTTTLYTIDSAQNELLIQNPPNNGTQVTVGTLGVDTTSQVGFDISAGGMALASLTPNNSSTSGLYSINLMTGAATLIGNIGGGARVTGLAIQETPVDLLALDNANNLLTIRSTSPATVTSSVAVTGLGAGETLVDLDFRPATGQLIGVTVDAGNTGRIYAINPATGVASFLSTINVALVGSDFAIDFNPTVDRLRLVSDADQNLRINVDTGAASTDVSLAFAAGLTSPNVRGVAYTNSFAGATATTLYDIDPTRDQLFVQSPPNNGTLVLVGSLGINANDLVGFDIAQNGTAYAALSTGGASGLYGINLSTGAATLIGTIGGGTNIISLVAAPTQGPLRITLTRQDANPDVLGTAPVSRTYRATVVNSLNQPVVGASVQFNVTGANTASALVVTDANGNADFTYTASLVGTDTVTATAQGGANPSATATVTNQAPPAPGVSSYRIFGTASLAIGSNNLLALEVRSGRSPSEQQVQFRDLTARFELRNTRVVGVSINGNTVTLFGEGRITGAGVPGTTQQVRYRIDVTDGGVGSAGDSASILIAPLAGGPVIYQSGGGVASGDLRVISTP